MTLQDYRTCMCKQTEPLQTVTAARKLRDVCSLEDSYDQPRQHNKKQRHHFTNKGLSSQSPHHILHHRTTFKCISLLKRASQVALTVKKLPANAGGIRDAGSIPGSGIWVRKIS